MSLTFQPMMESRPIREIAYDVLKKAIITGEIPAGERIVETEYADRLHISRTPLIGWICQNVLHTGFPLISPAVHLRYAVFCYVDSAFQHHERRQRGDSIAMQYCRTKEISSGRKRRSGVHSGIL